MDSTEQTLASTGSLISHATGIDTVYSSRMDLSRLRLEPWHVIKDTVKDIHAFIAVSEDCIVLAFRGSMSGTNLYTDLQITQVRLPGLVPRRRLRKARKGPAASVSTSGGKGSRSKHTRGAHGGDLTISIPRSTLADAIASYTPEDVEIGHLYTIYEGSHEPTDSDVSSIAGEFLEDGDSRSSSPGFAFSHSRFGSPFTKTTVQSGRGLESVAYRRRVTSDASETSEGEDKCASWFECFRKCISLVPVARQAFPRVHMGFWVSRCACLGHVF
jgi:hypothetical protein